MTEPKFPGLGVKRFLGDGIITKENEEIQKLDNGRTRKQNPRRGTLGEEHHMHLPKPMSDEDEAIVVDLLGHKILTSVDAVLINAPNGFMALMCPDCDHIRDKFDFLCKICAEQSDAERVHPFMLNSGGMLLSPTSPTREGDECEILLRHIRKTMPKKGMDLLVSKCHAACGAAYDKGLNFYHVLYHTFQGKHFIKNQIPDLRVAVFTQIYFAKVPQRKTYAVKAAAWWKYAERRNLF